MIIGDRLRALREQKELSQGDIEKRTGLLRCYISRVENGHTVPSIETLEKMAHALKVPIYAIFYESKEPPEQLDLQTRRTEGDIAWGTSSKESRTLAKFCRALGKMKKRDRHLLLSMASTLANKSKKRVRKEVPH